MDASPPFDPRPSLTQMIVRWWQSPGMQSIVGGVRWGISAFSHAVATLLVQTWDLLGVLARTLLKAATAAVAGAGVALVMVGIFALREPTAWDLALMRQHGPPVGPLALSLGIGLLTMLAVLVAIFGRRTNGAGMVRRATH
jgi:hypothetical protein